VTAATGPDGGRRPPVGVLVMAHGTPASADEVEAFYTRIRRGRPPTPGQLAELAARYEAIGGVSPLTERTAAQVDGLAKVLDELAPGRFVVRFGAKYTAPFIEDAAAELAAAGPEAVVGIVLTPHRSSMGSGEYHRRAEAALDPPAYRPVAQWYETPGFAGLVADRVDHARSRLPAADREGAMVLFTAHSLPARVVAEGDPYPEQVEDSARRVAERAGLAHWRVAWQSAGRTPEPWIGPDVLEVLSGLADEGYRGVVVCPIGFVADHLEVLYDIDVEAARCAEAVGLDFTRTDSLNDDPRFLRVLAEVVLAADAGRAAGGGR